MSERTKTSTRASETLRVPLGQAGSPSTRRKVPRVQWIVRLQRPVVHLLGGLLVMAAGCAGTPRQDAMEQDLAGLRGRIAELEHTEGRTEIRIEDLRDSVNLMVDRVETNRLALERRGIARSAPLAFGEPRGLSETGLASPLPYRPPSESKMGGGRIRTRFTMPIEPGQEEEYYAEPSRSAPARAAPARGSEERVTITEADFRRFTGTAAPTARRSAGGRVAKEPVTTERLEVTSTAKVIKEPTAESRSAMDVYKTALRKYRAGDYAPAFAEFEAYLKMKPPRDYLDNALYWLGECQFGMGEYPKAIKYFSRVARETPGGNKVPDSLLKASMAQARLGKRAKARAILYSLIETYPTANAAKLAAEKLKEFD